MEWGAISDLEVGYIDFPLDPGCAGVGDESEVDREIPPQCFDTIDNDNDGSIDYPEDSGCFSRGDDSERGECGDTFESGSLMNGVVVRGTLAQAVAASSGDPSRASLVAATRQAESTAEMIQVEIQTEAGSMNLSLNGQKETGRPSGNEC